jgi:hypothetical protein
MVNQSNQLTNSLTNTVQQLSSSLKAIQPLGNSETTQIITYALVGTVVAGLVVYHYIREQEAE